MAFISILTILLTVVQFAILIYLFFTVRTMHKKIKKQNNEINQILELLDDDSKHF